MARNWAAGGVPHRQGWPCLGQEMAEGRGRQEKKEEKEEPACFDGRGLGPVLTEHTI